MIPFCVALWATALALTGWLLAEGRRDAGEAAERSFRRGVVERYRG